LYAPLAHKLGLYKLKSELEDLSLKYTQRDTYYFIKDKLNETKASRDKYIAAFIEPIKKKVTEACFDVGFKNLSHFSKIYKEAYGVAPSW